MIGTVTPSCCFATPACASVNAPIYPSIVSAWSAHRVGPSMCLLGKLRKTGPGSSGCSMSTGGAPPSLALPGSPPGRRLSPGPPHSATHSSTDPRLARHHAPVRILPSARIVHGRLRSLAVKARAGCRFTRRDEVARTSQAHKDDHTALSGGSSSWTGARVSH